MYIHPFLNATALFQVVKAKATLILAAASKIYGLVNLPFNMPAGNMP